MLIQCDLSDQLGQPVSYTHFPRPQTHVSRVPIHSYLAPSANINKTTEFQVSSVEFQDHRAQIPNTYLKPKWIQKRKKVGRSMRVCCRHVLGFVITYMIDSSSRSYISFSGLKLDLLATEELKNWSMGVVMRVLVPLVWWALEMGVWSRVMMEVQSDSLISLLMTGAIISCMAEGLRLRCCWDSSCCWLTAGRSDSTEHLRNAASLVRECRGSLSRLQESRLASKCYSMSLSFLKRVSSIDQTSRIFLTVNVRSLLISSVSNYFLMC